MPRSTVEVGVGVIQVIFDIQVHVFAGVLQLFHLACSRPPPCCHTVLTGKRRSSYFEKLSNGTCTVVPNTHRRRRRDSTVELSRVGVASASAVCIEFATSSRRQPTTADENLETEHV